MNKPLRKSRLTLTKKAKLMEHFIAGATARTAASLVGVNKSTASYFFHRLRQIIYNAVEDQTPFHGEIEADESYFGGKRKGKRSRQGTRIWAFEAGWEGINSCSQRC